MADESGSKRERPKLVGNYIVRDTLGSGSFGKVKVAVNKDTRERFAMKIIDKEKLRQQSMTEQLRREITAMRTLDHPHVVKFVDVLQTPNNIYLVMELITGGELFDKIVHSRRLTEDVARRYLQQLVYAVHYSHSRRIAHRDLKPENLLLDSNDNLKITDFGLSNLQESDDAVLNTVCGTPHYVAPEVLSQRAYNGFVADVWSIGVVLFVMVSGYLPFDDPVVATLFEKIAAAKYTPPGDLSPALLYTISRLLDPNPATRMSLVQLMSDPWLTAVPVPESLIAASMGAVPDAGPPADVRTVDAAAPVPTRESVVAQVTNGQILDAFALAAKLSGLKDIRATADLAAITYSRALRLMIRGTVESAANAIVSAVTARGGNAVAEGSLVRGFVRIGSVPVFQMQIEQIAGNEMCLVDVRRSRGAVMDFHSFYQMLMQDLLSMGLLPSS